MFYSPARVDGLVKRVETHTEMIEYFVDRDDFMHYKHTTFGRRSRVVSPNDSTELNVRPITVSALCLL